MIISLLVLTTIFSFFFLQSGLPREIREDRSCSDEPDEDLLDSLKSIRYMEYIEPGHEFIWQFNDYYPNSSYASILLKNASQIKFIAKSTINSQIENYKDIEPFSTPGYLSQSYLNVNLSDFFEISIDSDLLNNSQVRSEPLLTHLVSPVIITKFTARFVFADCLGYFANYTQPMDDDNFLGRSSDLASDTILFEYSNRSDASTTSYFLEYSKRSLALFNFTQITTGNISSHYSFTLLSEKYVQSELSLKTTQYLVVALLYLLVVITVFWMRTQLPSKFSEKW